MLSAWRALQTKNASRIVFGVGLTLATVTVLPGIVEEWDRLTAELPIIIKDQRINWQAPRILHTRSEGVRWTDTCPVVSLARYLVMEDGEAIPVNGKITAGPLAGTTRAPRYEIAISPMERPGSEFEINVPDWIDVNKIKFFMSTIKVPNDRPCESGRVWNQTLLQITVPPRPPDLADRPMQH
jgi:hypothetical protein